MPMNHALPSDEMSLRYMPTGIKIIDENLSGKQGLTCPGKTGDGKGVHWIPGHKESAHQNDAICQHENTPLRLEKHYSVWTLK